MTNNRGWFSTQLRPEAQNSSYYRARYYDPATGRFVTEDPSTFDGGINFYAYVLNHPTDNFDPFGLKCTTKIMLVTAYCAKNRHVADWPRRPGPGTVAVANTKPKPYPFGCKVKVEDISTGHVDYQGTTHDTGAGWDSAHHDVLPDAWIDLWMGSCKSANQYGVRYRTVTICCDCDKKK